MPYRLLRFGFARAHPEPRMFTRHESLKAAYDVVIIGAGGHGLAAAYYLARDHGIRNVAVLEKGYIGGGNTGRNTTIIRSNYLTPEGVKFYDESLRLWQDLSTDFDLNLFYSTRGHFTLAHTDAAMRTMRWRAEVNKHYGVRSEAVDAAFVKRALPMIDMECGGHAPIVGALFHEPGAIARHDAVAWGYGRGADRRGVEIHQQTEVTGIRVQGGRVVGVETTRGSIATPKVLCAVAGYTPRILDMLDLHTPIYIHPLQAMVSEPVKPWLDPIIVSGSLHVYVSQTARGELVMGASLDPYELHQTRATLDFVEGLSAHMLDMFPFLGEVKVNRQWAGLSDMTPDFAPIMGVTPVEGFYLDAGWGTWGFKATPVCGKTMSHTVATGRNHPLIEGFTMERFRAVPSHRRKRRGIGGSLKILVCPLNGPRPVSEFAYGGELRRMPDPETCSDREWSDYVFNRSGSPGIKYEWWCHIASGFWFIAQRDTARDHVLATYPAEAVRAGLGAGAP